MENKPEGTTVAGADDQVTLTKEEHQKMVEAIAKGREAEARMKDEITELREKNRIVTQVHEPKPEDVEKIVEAKFKEKEAEELKKIIQLATESFVGSHSEFSKEEDPDGSTLEAFQKVLGRFNLAGVKTYEDYVQVLEDALSLMPHKGNPVSIPSSTPRTPSAPVGKPNTGSLTEKEVKLVKQNFGGDVEAYMKIKTKRPEYIEGLLEYVR